MEIPPPPDKALEMLTGGMRPTQKTGNLPSQGWFPVQS